MSLRHAYAILRPYFAAATIVVGLGACDDDVAGGRLRDAGRDTRTSAEAGVSMDAGRSPDGSASDAAIRDAGFASDGAAEDAGSDSASPGDVPSPGDTGAQPDAPIAVDVVPATEVGIAGDAPLDAAAGGGSEAGPAPDAGGIVANRPELAAATPARIAQLRVPPGFRVQVFARELTNPRMLAVGPDGSVYVTSPMTSQVLRLIDRDGDGSVTGADERSTVLTGEEAEDLQGVHGITIHEGRVYLASVKAVYAADLVNGSFSGLTRLVGDLPDGGQHPNRTLAVGPDRKLYVSVGSTCNACNESNSQHATMLRFELDGRAAANPENPEHPVLAHNPLASVSPRVFASGLRNTLGFDWYPPTNQLIGADQGSDGLGNDIPNDEINAIAGGRSYGWPYCWGDRAVDPTVDDPSQALSKEAYCQTTAPMHAPLPAHSSPIGFLFYRGTQFPSDYLGDAFVALRGSWNRDVPTGYKVVRIRFQAGHAVEDFLTGFLIDNGAAQFGRVAGLAVDHQGALLIAEDSNGVVYRVTYVSDVDGGAVDGSGG